MKLRTVRCYGFRLVLYFHPSPSIEVETSHLADLDVIEKRAFVIARDASGQRIDPQAAGCCHPLGYNRFIPLDPDRKEV